ncbi:MAG: FkbM family methyltransferase [Ignavibacteria bacterium]
MNLKLLRVRFDMILNKLANLFGVNAKMLDEEILIKTIKANQIDLILDVGANTGQFSELVLKLGYEGSILSFEPLSAAYELLLRKSQKFKKWKVFDKCAIGDIDGTISINVSQNLLSSSALKILEHHTSVSPESNVVAIEAVPIYKLDSISAQYEEQYNNILLKIDTQGYEEKVLIGSANFLSSVKGVLVEVSLTPLYEGQKLFDDIYEMLKTRGFNLWGIFPAFVNRANGRMLQVDLLLFK